MFIFNLKISAFYLRATDRNVIPENMKLEEIAKLKDQKKLVELIQSHDDSISWEAAKRLSTAGNKATIKKLINLAKEKNNKRRLQIIYCLSFSGYLEAVKILFEIYGSEQETPSIKGHCAEGLGNLLEFSDKRKRIYKCVAQKLLDYLEVGNDNIEVKFWTIFALGKLRYKKAIPILSRIAKTDKRELKGWWSINKEAKDAIKIIKEK